MSDRYNGRIIGSEILNYTLGNCDYGIKSDFCEIILMATVLVVGDMNRKLPHIRECNKLCVLSIA